MSDKFADEPDSPELTELSRLLDNAAVWAEPSVELEDQIVAAIAADRVDPALDTPADADADDEDGPVIDLGERRARRAGGRRFWTGAVAAAVLIIAISATAGYTLGRSDDAGLTTVALAPTDQAADASAVVRIDDRPNGARLLVELSRLEPAPLGFFYEVWLVKAEPRTVISAGTFHMRGSDSGEIELWAGVSPEEYPIVTVTLESEAEPSARGELILQGEVGAS